MTYYVINLITSDMSNELEKLDSVNFYDLQEEDQLQNVLDCTFLLNQRRDSKCYVEKLSIVEFHSRTLLHGLVGARYKMLLAIPKRQR